MAFSSANFWNVAGMAPGRSLYMYHTTDPVDEVEDAGYFNNKDDLLNLQKGDVIFAFTWSDTPFEAANTISEAKTFVVTNVISNDAAASAGAVNVAEAFIATGLLSSDG